MADGLTDTVSHSFAVESTLPMGVISSYVTVVGAQEKVKTRRWLGHVLRMSKSRHPLIALTCNPQGARKKGRSQVKWRRSVESERVESVKTWNELSWLAQDRLEWRKFVGALCSQGDYR
ncbi:hypothetical protein ElyMa_003477000 [Elysia marginata]|uniref:Uncharacterized protein n=1 Tax=Elysia marginata TaxID=1093978 RepID=A0AAV4EC30_9GAST|nr:hypothetical protein ElyMa_003477000 [Elysia marginata]